MITSAFAVGSVFRTKARTLTAGEISTFADLVGDHMPIHVDTEFARRTPYGTVIAHGPLCLSAAIGLFTQTVDFGRHVVGLLGLTWEFTAPVKAGDAIRAEVTVSELRATSKPGRTVGAFAVKVVNQHGATVETGTMKVLLQDL